VTDAIRDYITANRGGYTDEAIRAALVEAGHDPAEVDRVSAGIRAEASGRSLVSYTTVLYILGFLALLPLAFIFSEFTRSLGGSSASELAPLIGLAIYLVLGFGVVWITRRATRGRHVRGIAAFAAYLGVLVVFGVLVFGSCLAGPALLG